MTTEEEDYGRAFREKIQKEVKKSDQITEETGTSTVFKVFIIGLIIFGGLMATGLLTGPDTVFDGNNQGPSSDPNIIDEGTPTYQQIDQLCVNHGSIQTHYHYTVEILVDGSQQQVPPGIGDEPGCLKPIHTHDTPGYIHVELPSDYTGTLPTLGDFFSIWGQPLSSTQLLQYSGDVTLKVNGQVRSGNVELYVPEDNDLIELSIET